MADFDSAYDATLAHEGGYADDPHDRGGETYKGIARVHHADWPGWQRVDALKGDGFPRNLAADAVLQQQVRDFYREHYWDRIAGDRIPDQAIADKLFDTAVNMGLRSAVRFLQEAINLLDRKPPEAGIAVDGWLGNATLKALRERLRRDRTNRYVLILLRVLQGHRYVEIMRAAPSQEKFARGWLKRAET